MKLSTKGRYAVMAMVDLAGHSRGSAGERSPRSPSAQEISLSYLEQLFAQLRRGGLVKSVRGPGGGYLLAHDRSTIRASPTSSSPSTSRSARRAARWATGTGCRGDKSRCLTHDLWEELGNQIHLYLSSVSACRCLRAAGARHQPAWPRPSARCAWRRRGAGSQGIQVPRPSWTARSISTTTRPRR